MAAITAGAGPPPKVPWIPARYVMHCLLGSAYGMNILQRNSVNFIVPFIVRAQKFSDAQAAVLLAGFFPGYVVTQIPAGLIARSVGEKSLTTINCVANGLLFSLLPSVCKLGAWPLAVCLTTMGLLQGTIVPCMVGMQVWWLPRDGPEKVWAARSLSIGSVWAQIVAGCVTPVLATSATGWSLCAYSYGAANLAFAAVWYRLAANKPDSWRGPPTMGPAERALLELSRPDITAGKRVHTNDRDVPGVTHEQEQPLGIVDLLRVPAARGCCFCAFGIGTLVYNLVPAAPSYFMTQLRCDPLLVGRLLALPPVVMQATDLATAAVEASLLRRGWKLLDVRRTVSCGGLAMGALGVRVSSPTRSVPARTIMIYNQFDCDFSSPWPRN
jgi:hypothetical protein